MRRYFSFEEIFGKCMHYVHVNLWMCMYQNCVQVSKCMGVHV